MTPTEQDKELREQIEKQFDDFIKKIRVDTPDGWEVKKYIDLDEVLQLITADRKRVALEARLDELRRASDMQYIMRRADRVSYCSDRLIELRSRIRIDAGVKYAPSEYAENAKKFRNHIGKEEV